MAPKRIPDGTKVIVRCNDWHEDLMVGVVISYETLGGKILSPGMPKIKSDADGKEYLCGGCIEVYTAELENKLRTLSPKEQWNALSDNIKF